MTIKKSFTEIVEFLEANKNKKVSTILDEIYSITSQKSMSKTFLTNDKGEVFAIFCYYHKQWELLSEVDYGLKASSTTGYNTMCKIGVKHWTAQNKQAKEVGSRVLAMLEEGEISASEINETRERLLAETRTIITDDMPIGYNTAEDAFDMYNDIN
jgi:hypothetical protein